MQIWDLSDPNGKGYLNKAGFFVALKLVSLAQSGKEINVLSTTIDVPPPKMVNIYLIHCIINHPMVQFSYKQYCWKKVAKFQDESFKV